MLVWSGIHGNLSHLYQKDYTYGGVLVHLQIEVMQKFVVRSVLRT